MPLRVVSPFDTPIEGDRRARMTNDDAASTIDHVREEYINALHICKGGPELENEAHCSAICEVYTCSKCRLRIPEHEVHDGIRAKSVRRMTSICNRCLHNGRLLRNHFGQWPMKDFQAMPEQEQVNFWRWAHDEIGYGRSNKKKTQTLVDRIITVVSTNQVKRAKSACNSEYRPLEYWVRMGFDKESILNNCQTTKEHEIHGTVYMLGVEYVDEEAIKFETMSRLRRCDDNAQQPWPWDEDAHFPPLRKQKKDKKDKKEKKDHNDKNDDCLLYTSDAADE